MEGQPARNLESISGTGIKLAYEATIPHMFLQSSLDHFESPCLIYKQGYVFENVPYKRLLNLVENFTLSLGQLGIKKGDRLAILSENRPEWVVSDLSAVSIGAILAPIHTALTSEQIREILFELEPKALIISEKKLLVKLIKTKKELDSNIILIYYNIDLQEDLSEFKNERCHFIEALKLLPHKNHSEEYKKLIKKVRPGDTASIVYTIGPNGKYRGVELSHKNFVENVKGASENVLFKPNDKFLSVLPLSHAFERTAGYYMPLAQGASITYVTDISKFSKLARECKPTIIIGVPRLYEKSYKKIQEQVSKSKLKKYLFDTAIRFGSSQKNQTRIAYKLYDRLVYRHIKESFGGELRLMISGGAALNPEVGAFFNASGVPILEGYGLTEYSPIVSVNKLGRNKVGTVGPPIGNTQIKIADDGEILIKGPGVMKGYYQNGNGPELALEKGWFRTGDLGELDEDDHLKIIGRKKEVIVLSTGKNVSPRKIESQLTLNKYIKQAAVVGNDQKHIVALIVPDFARLQRKIGLSNKKSIMKNREVKAFLQTEIGKELKEFARHEQVKRFALLENQFSIENHFLNADSSLNRDKISTVYGEIIVSLYENGKKFN